MGVDGLGIFRASLALFLSGLAQTYEAEVGGKRIEIY
jgi:hypothetical protein